MSLPFKNPNNHDSFPADAPIVNVQIDGQWHQVPKGTNVIEVSQKFGKHIPHYCYHPKLTISGNCRMCLFEMGLPKCDASRKPILNKEGKPEISWLPRPQIACATLATEGMGIRTDSKLIKECRSGVMEFLLINHPLDCPICDQAGECKLQEFSVEHGGGESRFVEEKVHKPKQVDIGERIVLDDERCIMCSRCIRFAQEVCEDDVLGFTERGSHTTLTTHPDRRFDHNYSLNTVDICPVGALTSKDFRFKMRVWFLKETSSICTGCGTGCNITISSRENEIYRLTPRTNEDVNTHWMCDSGRLGFHHVHSKDRILSSSKKLKNEEPICLPYDKIIEEAAEALKSASPENIAIIASGSLTNEELFLISEIGKALEVKSSAMDIIPYTEEPDGILRCGDLNANTQGANLLKLGSNGKNLAKIRTALEKKTIDTLLVFGEDLTTPAAGFSEELLAKAKTILTLSSASNKTTALSHFVLAGSTFAEKRGSMINTQGRLQRINKAITCSPVQEDWITLSVLLAKITALPSEYTSVDCIFKKMAPSEWKLETLKQIGDLGFATT